jgi:hypothetical protein
LSYRAAAAGLWNCMAATHRFGLNKNGHALNTIAKSNTGSEMNTKVLILSLCLSMAGCMSPRVSPPVNVAMVPNDCRNREIIINWLSEQAAIPRQPGETEDHYERHRRQIRAKIWNMRYHCQPV